MANLAQFASTHGVVPGKVDQAQDSLVINGHAIQVSHARSPHEVDWKKLNIDILLECSGHYGSRAQLQQFLDAVCPRVLVSQPANSARDVDYTVLYGLNQDGLTGRETLVSTASCTTNALAPVLDELVQAFGTTPPSLTPDHTTVLSGKTVYLPE